MTNALVSAYDLSHLADMLVATCFKNVVYLWTGIVLSLLWRIILPLFCIAFLEPLSPKLILVQGRQKLKLNGGGLKFDTIMISLHNTHIYTCMRSNVPKYLNRQSVVCCNELRRYLNHIKGFLSALCEHVTRNIGSICMFSLITRPKISKMSSKCGKTPF